MTDFDEAFYLAQNPDVVVALRSGLVASGWEHYIRFGREEGRAAVPPKGTGTAAVAMDPRPRAAVHLEGRGVEVGALHAPFPAPEGTTVVYCDRVDGETAKTVFPELKRAFLQSVDVILDLDAGGLSRSFPPESQDFAVFARGIQQLANPIGGVEQLFRVTKPGGIVVVSIPDRRFTAEHARPLTSWEHVLEEYLQGVSVVTDAHYVDLLHVYAPKVLFEGVSGIEPRLKEFRRRLEHAHVWDTATFREFMKRALRVCDVEAELVEEASGDDTRSEYLAVFRKHGQLLG